jgi:hypothetical protein
MTKPDRQQSQTTESVPSRTMAPLSFHLEKHLKTYAMTTAAAGVGLLSPVLPADAQVVYTPAHIKITEGDLFLDFNCGPRVNFWLADNLEYSSRRELALNGGINASVIEDRHGPAALPQGSVVGSSRTFTNVHQNERVMAEAYNFVYYGTGVSGNWANVKQAYLGLKFDIKGQVHYGWAEFSVNASVRNRHQLLVDATLLGYAYEATPNQSIKTGQKSGAAGDAAIPGALVPQPGTLQALAQGVAGKGGCPDYEPHGAVRHKPSKTP